MRFATAALQPLAFDYNAVDVGVSAAGRIPYAVGTGGGVWPGMHNFMGGCGLPSAPGDYHLVAGAGAPCIDQGIAVGGPIFDFEGGTRDAMPDIGADEFGAP